MFSEPLMKGILDQWVREYLDRGGATGAMWRPRRDRPGVKIIALFHDIKDSSPLLTRATLEARGAQGNAEFALGVRLTTLVPIEIGCTGQAEENCVYFGEERDSRFGGVFDFPQTETEPPYVWRRIGIQVSDVRTNHAVVVEGTVEVHEPKHGVRESYDLRLELG